MGWNHRILAHDFGDEIQFEIHEVYYDENGEPNGYTSNGVSVAAESLDGIKWVLERMTECMDKPVLWADERFPQEYIV